MWIIRKQGARGNNVYVSPPDRKHSYTDRKHAQRFGTREAAQSNCCGNEYPVQLQYNES